MSSVDKIMSGSWKHGAGEMRIEEAAIASPAIADHLARLALRFIAIKGLAGEFADALEEIQQIENIETGLGDALGLPPEVEVEDAMSPNP